MTNTTQIERNFGIWVALKVLLKHELINQETFDKIEELSNNPFVLRSAVKNLLNEGVQTVKCMTEEEIASLDDATAEFYRLMKRVVEITDDVNDIVSYCQAVGYLNPFIH